MGLLAAAQQAIRRVSLTRDLSKLTQSSGDNVAYVSDAHHAPSASYDLAVASDCHARCTVDGVAYAHRAIARRGPQW